MRTCTLAARDFLDIEDAARMDAVLTAQGYRLRPNADISLNHARRPLIARLVWRNRHRDTVVLTLRVRG